MTDEGPGMGPQPRSRAFDRFWRGGQDGRGTGLGLAIVKKLVEADGGDVQIDESAMGGLDVTLRL